MNPNDKPGQQGGQGGQQGGGGQKPGQPGQGAANRAAAGAAARPAKSTLIPVIRDALLFPGCVQAGVFFSCDRRIEAFAKKE